MLVGREGDEFWTTGRRKIQRTFSPTVVGVKWRRLGAKGNDVSDRYGALDDWPGTRGGRGQTDFIIAQFLRFSPKNKCFPHLLLE